MPDLTKLSDDALIEALHAADDKRLAARDEAKAVSTEISRRNRAKRLAKLAESISADDAAEIAKLHQTVAPPGIKSAGKFGNP
jgi:hypothetical protein